MKPYGKIAEGEFGVCEESMKSKIKRERWKMFRHRAGLLWNVFGGIITAIVGLLAWHLSARLIRFLGIEKDLVLAHIPGLLFPVLAILPIIFAISWWQESGDEKWKNAMSRWNEGGDLLDRIEKGGK